MIETYLTENSAYLIHTVEKKYCRLPRTEAPRVVDAPSLEDGIWMPYEGIFLVKDPYGTSLLIKYPAEECAVVKIGGKCEPTHMHTILTSYLQGVPDDGSAGAPAAESPSP